MENLEVRIVLTVLLGSILLATMPTTLGLSLGVKSGNWIVYDFQASFSEERGQMIEFETVTGTNLTVVVTDSWANTQTSETGYVDLATNEDFSTSIFTARTYVIPVNISVGDSVYLGNQLGNRTISGETTGNYAGADRSVVYANFSLPTGNHYTLYWDKQTGVLVEGTIFYGNDTVSEDLTTVGTNMWAGGLGYWLWVLIAVAVACGIITSKKDAIKKLARKSHARRTDEKTAK
jgi:hypothetical protein